MSAPTQVEHAPGNEPGVGAAHPDFEVLVLNHRPAPQGSKRHIGHGRMIEQSVRVKPWRHAAASAVREALAAARGQDGPEPAPLDGALFVQIVFTVRKPARPKRPTWPVTRDSGDLDKLLRSTFDALTDGGAIADDSRVVKVVASKVHPGEGEGALDAPGAVIRVWRLGEAQATVRAIAAG
ncbi:MULTISPECIES: RusA family crossover junction endodeoxyribonuclease [Streptomyces]|uniref:RusA family crossover junction endodeoxyribonuclease n=1 Tax=Streptomyces TaxID=1883 RepID=UPI0029A306E5|nr:RusA family crossover junction endodeoxyribonuclease [Streptomyces scabiei]MDX3205079.1 RusA family crossover junction endodeoxyribonuclease [Streptomyces scabiei]